MLQADAQSPFTVEKNEIISFKFFFIKNKDFH
jgi:hypothetical protein